MYITFWVDSETKSDAYALLQKALEKELNTKRIPNNKESTNFAIHSNIGNNDYALFIEDDETYKQHLTKF